MFWMSVWPLHKEDVVHGVSKHCYITSGAGGYDHDTQIPDAEDLARNAMRHCTILGQI